MDVFWPALVSFLVTVFATPVTIYLAKKYGLLDDPKLRPHPAHQHSRVIPRAGGLPIYAGILLACLTFLPMQKYLIGIFIGITILLILGLVDDKRLEFSPYTRFIFLFVAAAAAVGAGIGISYIGNPLAASGSIIHLDQIVYNINFLGPHKLILIADIFAFIWIVALTQIVNWSKGVDGQMPGITFVAAAVLGLLSLKFYYQGDINQLNIAILAFIVAGASLGLLIFNWYPSKILPGFAGSTILAYMLAVLAILSGAKIATALLVLAIPSVDFVYLFFKRILSGHSPVWADQNHLHHKLRSLGWSHQKISLFYILGSAILGAVALTFDSANKLLAIVFVAVVFFGFVLWKNSSGALSGQRGPNNG